MRLFFAIWPSPAAADRLRELAARVAEETGGRATPPENIHLTLEFLGEVAEARIPALVRAAASVEAARFRLKLDRLGAFRRARVAWIGSRTPPARLLALQRQLADALRSAGFAPEERAYSPHVTLARKTGRLAPRATAEPIEWLVTEFALVRSEAGKAGYASLARWRLG